MKKKVATYANVNFQFALVHNYKGSLDSPDNLSIVIILDLLLMARVHGIS